MSITLVLNVLMTALLIWEETTIQQDSVSIKGFWTLKKRKIIFETFLIHIVKIFIEIFHLVSAIIVFYHYDKDGNLFLQSYVLYSDI